MSTWLTISGLTKSVASAFSDVATISPPADQAMTVCVPSRATACSPAPSPRYGQTGGVNLKPTVGCGPAPVEKVHVLPPGASGRLSVSRTSPASVACSMAFAGSGAVDENTRSCPDTVTEPATGAPASWTTRLVGESVV